MPDDHPYWLLDLEDTHLADLQTSLGKQNVVAIVHDDDGIIAYALRSFADRIVDSLNTRP